MKYPRYSYSCFMDYERTNHGLSERSKKNNNNNNNEECNVHNYTFLKSDERVVIRWCYGLICIDQLDINIHPSGILLATD